MFYNIIKCFIQATIIGSIMICLIIFISLLLKKTHSYKWRYWVWLLLAIRIIIPFKIQLPQVELERNILKIDEVLKVPLETEIFNNSFNELTFKSITNASQTDVYSLIVYIWIVGFILYIAYQIACYISIRKSMRKWSIENVDEHIMRIYDDIVRNMRIKNKPKIRLWKKAISPMMIGFIKSELLLPTVDYSDENFKMIFKHELTHYKRNDSLYKLLMLTVNAIHWFNPFVYIMVMVANNDIELCCDCEVVKNKDIEYKKSYSELILSHISIIPRIYAVGTTQFSTNNKSIKNRFKYIFDETNKKRGIATCTSIFSMLIMCSFISIGNNEDLRNNVFENSSFNLAMMPYEILKLNKNENEMYVKPIDSNKIVMVNSNEYIVFVADKDSPVSAVYEGRVSSIGNHYSYGNFIKINGDDGLDIIYCHLQVINVAENQLIAKNEIIGTAGATGYAFLEGCGLRAFKGDERIDISKKISFTGMEKIVYKDSQSFMKDKDTLFQ